MSWGGYIGSYFGGLIGSLMDGGLFGG